MAETLFDRVKRQTGHEIQFSEFGYAEKCPYEYGLESERAVNLCDFNPDKVPWNERCRACWNREAPKEATQGSAGKFGGVSWKEAGGNG